MSLYGLQKAIFEVNRDAAVMSRYLATPGSFATAYALTAEEAKALSEPDIGLMYVLGVNGQWPIADALCRRLRIRVGRVPPGHGGRHFQIRPGA